jgi:hypothetical protein
VLQQPDQQLNFSVDNITRRKYNVPIQNSFDSLNDEDYDSSILRNGTLNRSCPDLTVNYKEEVEVLKSKIAHLQEKLELSDSYSTKLLLDNEKLHKQLTACARQIQQLKDICKSTKKTTKATKTLNKVKYPLSEKDFDNMSKDGTEKSPNLQSQTSDTEKSSHDSSSESLYTIEQTQSPHSPSGVSENNFQQINYVNPTNNTKRNKICVVSSISSRNNINILNIILKTFSDTFDCFHGSYHGGRIHQLLSNLTNNIHEYTLRDYCILMVGEEDFEIHRDYDHTVLVQEIKNTLKTITHTNIIVCTPTYVCGAPIYNYRVELFNTLLNEDIQANNYAHFLDTNLGLPLNMFSFFSGKITNLGMVEIFKYIDSMIKNDELLEERSLIHINTPSAPTDVSGFDAIQGKVIKKGTTICVGTQTDVNLHYATTHETELDNEHGPLSSNFFRH